MSGLSADDAEGAPAAINDAVLALATPWPELAAAESLLTYQCLQDQGFELPAQVRPPLAAPTPPNLGGIVGLLDERARRIGYGNHFFRGQPTDVVGQLMDSLPAARRTELEEALNGDGAAPRVEIQVGDQHAGAPAQGCVARARTVIYGSVETFLRLTYLPVELVGHGAALLRSPRVLTAFERHAELMRVAGYDVGSLKDVRRLAQSRHGSRPRDEPASSAELQLAVADLDAQLDADLRGCLNREALRLAVPYLHCHGPEILELRAMQDEARLRASTVLVA